MGDRQDLEELRRIDELERRAAGSAQASAVPESMGAKIGEPVANTLATLASGGLAAPISGIAGLAGAVLPGPEGQGADWVRKTQDALTVAPQTKASATLTDIATKPLQWLAKGADAAGGAIADATGSPAAGAALNTGIQLAPALLGKAVAPKLENMAARSAQERAGLKSAESVRNATLDEGRAAGYVVPPPDSILRGVGGKAAIRQEAIARNQQTTDALARQAAGLPDNAPITRSSLDARISQEAAPYREVEQLSANHPLFQPPFKKPGETLKDLQEARYNENAWYQYSRRTGNPVALKRAEKFGEKADLLESSIEKAAEALGNPDLVQRVRDARVKMAKIYDIKRALNEGDGTVDAHVIGNAYDKNPGKYTGELATIGKFDQAFRRYTNPISATPEPGGGALVPHAAAALGIAGHASGMGWWPAGLALAGGPTRSLLLSGLYQKPKTYGPSLTEMGLTGLSNEGTPLGLAGSQSLADFLRRQK